MDEQVGKHKKGRIEEYPKKFIDGTDWLRGYNPTPTVHYVDEHHFVLLPIGQGRLTDEQRTALDEHIAKSKSSPRQKKQEDE